MLWRQNLWLQCKDSVVTPWTFNNSVFIVICELNVRDNNQTSKVTVTKALSRRTYTHRDTICDLYSLKGYSEVKTRSVKRLYF